MGQLCMRPVVQFKYCLLVGVHQLSKPHGLAAHQSNKQDTYNCGFFQETHHCQVLQRHPSHLHPEQYGDHEIVMNKRHKINRIVF